MARQSNSPWKDQIMQVRREAAEARQKVYDALSPQDKLARLDRYGFRAAKERAKIARKLEGSKK